MVGSHPGHKGKAVPGPFPGEAGTQKRGFLESVWTEAHLLDSELPAGVVTRWSEGAPGALRLLAPRFPVIGVGFSSIGIGGPFLLPWRRGSAPKSSVFSPTAATKVGHWAQSATSL
jgi:hypothetical protein